MGLEFMKHVTVIAWLLNHAALYISFMGKFTAFYMILNMYHVMSQIISYLLLRFIWITVMNYSCIVFQSLYVAMHKNNKTPFGSYLILPTVR